MTSLPVCPLCFRHCPSHIPRCSLLCPSDVLSSTAGPTPNMNVSEFPLKKDIVHFLLHKQLLINMVSSAS